MNHNTKTADMPMVLVALGGHAFMQRGETGTVENQERNAARICQRLYALIERGYGLVITHGNGPQVGNLLLLNETGDPSVPKMPLDVLVAQTEGSLGYFLQQALLNELRDKEANRDVVTMITQVLVDPSDPAFDKPSKPIGPFLTENEARQKTKTHGWEIIEQPGRGWRRIVPSPKPLRVVQRQMIRDSAVKGHIVVAAGGGGIPIIQKPDGAYEGKEAVIDKDLTSSILATEIGAEILIILTGVPHIFERFGTPDQQPLSAVTAAQLQTMVDQGEFPKGSMGPKVASVIGFLDRGGKRAIVTDPDTLPDALMGQGGTHIVGRC